VIVALSVVFGWVLPQFIDYEEVWDALTQLDAWDVVVLLGLGLARVPTETLMYRAFLPGLGLWRGSEAYLSSNLAGQLLPPPSASVVQYGYFRGGGYAPDAVGLAAVGSSLFPMIGRFLLPLVALFLLLLTGELNGLGRVGGGALARRHGRCRHRRLLLPTRRTLGAGSGRRRSGRSPGSWSTPFLMAMLVELGSPSDDALVAAALLWRVFYSVLTLPLGAITLGRFRKANPDVLRLGTAEAPVA
jgi:uncharacterized membrane protein YbhN (UPF0104 family)